MSKSSIWDSFEKSDYAKTVIASLDKRAKEEKVAPASAPGPLEGVGWQKGNGYVPDVTKTHDIKETHTAVENLAKKAPTGKVAATLVRLVKIAEAWESQVAAGNEKLVPFIAELDSIIDSTMAEHVTASAIRKKKLIKAENQAQAQDRARSMPIAQEWCAKFVAKTGIPCHAEDMSGDPGFVLIYRDDDSNRTHEASNEHVIGHLDTNTQPPSLLLDKTEGMEPPQERGGLTNAEVDSLGGSGTLFL